MTYGEATQWARWDESLAYALGEAACQQAMEQARHGASWGYNPLRHVGYLVKDMALSRELTLEDRDSFEFRLVSFPFLTSDEPGRVTL